MRKFAQSALLGLSWAVRGRDFNSSPAISVSRSWRVKTRFPFPALGVAALLVFAPAVMAQNASTLPRRAAASAPTYNAAKEVVVQGAVQSLVHKPTPGLMPGDHLMLNTPQGTVDAQIGKFLLRGNTLSLTSGQQVRLVGMMTTFRNRGVLVVRLIQTDKGTITVRNQRGSLVVPFLKSPALKTSNAGGAL
jgi:hypothetical protein